MRSFVGIATLVLLLGRVAAGDSTEFDEKLLRQLGLPTDGPGLLQFFRQRTPTAEQVKRYQSHLGRLSSDDYRERARASADLVAMGPAVRPLLLQTLHDPPEDREIVRRLEQCLVALQEDKELLPALASARLLAVKKPAETAAVLLAYAPFAGSELVRQEVQQALNAVAFTGGAPDARLLAALTDAEPYRRAAAGEALIRGNRGALQEKVRPLLQDPHAQVRLQVALAFAETGHKAGVPVLIELLGLLPTARAWPAQEVLLRLAEQTDEPPTTLDGRHSAKEVALGWRTWWHAHEKRINVARLAEPTRDEGYTLIAHATKGLNGKVVELGPNGQVRWEIDGLRYPFDVQYVGKSRVLVAEFYGRRVTERDTKGSVLWEKAVNMPIACQRLPAGQTFIACRNQLLIVDRDGSEVFTYAHPNTSILAAQRLRDGRFVMVTSGGVCQVLDPHGQLLKSFRVGQLYTMGSNLEVLPGNRILVPLYNESRVAEFDLEGNLVWQAHVQNPTTATRLANGNTLVGSQQKLRVVEINLEGQEVWDYRTDGRPWRARRR